MSDQSVKDSVSSAVTNALDALDSLVTVTQKIQVKSHVEQNINILETVALENKNATNFDCDNLFALLDNLALGYHKKPEIVQNELTL